MKLGTVVFGLVTVVLVVAAALWIGVVPLGTATGVEPQVAPRADTALPVPPPVSDGEPEPLVPEVPATGPAAAGSEAVAHADDAADDEPGHPVVFVGRVVDAAGEPLADAGVLHLPTAAMAKGLGLRTPLMGMSLFTTPWEEFEGARTDAGGRFRIETRELPPTDLERVRSSGPEQVGLVLHHPEAVARVERAPAGRAPEDGLVDLGDLVLQPAGRLTGRLVDEHGSGVADVTVRAAMDSMTDTVNHRGFRGLLDATSGPDGRFTVGSVPAGSGTLGTSGGPWLPASLPFQSPGEGVVDLGEISLATGLVLEGLITDTAGNPLPGADVLLRTGTMRFGNGDDPLVEIQTYVSMSARRAEVRLTTDAEGRYVAPGLAPEDTYDVLALAEGHDAAVLRACAPGPTSHDLALPSEALLIVQVVDAATGSPVACETVTASRPAETPESGWGASLTSLTGGDAAAFLGRDGEATGLAVLRKAGAHSHRVTVNAPGYPPTEVVLPGVPAGSRLEQRIALQPGPSLAGRVTDDEGRGMPALLTLKADTGEGRTVAGREHRREPTDDDGAFLIDLAEGLWTVTAEAPGWRTSDPFTVDAQGTVDHEHTFVLDRGATLDLIVVDPRGLPIADLAVSLRPVVEREGPLVRYTVPQPHTATTDDTGRARFIALAPGLFSTWLHGKVELDVPPGHSEQVLVRPDLPVLSGRVLQGGRAVAGARVEVGDSMWGGDEPELTTATGDDGTFRVSDATLAGGDVTSWMVTPFLDGSPGAPRVVSFDGNREHDVDLYLGLSSLTGVVRGAAGPVAGARVHAVNRDHLRALADEGVEGFWARRSEADRPDDVVRWRSAPTSTLTHETTTGEDGAFVLPHLLPGPHRLMVEAEGYLTLDDTEVLVAGAEALDPVVLQLESGLVVSGHLTHADGTPGKGLKVVLHVEPNSMHTTTGDDGGFTFQGVPVGNWSLQVNDPVFVLGVDGRTSELLSTQVEVPPEGLLPLSLFLAPPDG